MRKKMFFSVLVSLILLACQKESDVKQHPHDVNQPGQSDRKPNGGFLRLVLEDRPMHDTFFEAQFTPRGDMFQSDNLQLYNYNVGSEKYPRILIDINGEQSDIKQWSETAFSLSTLSFAAAPGTTPLGAEGEIRITKATNRSVEGNFDGELLNEKSGKRIPLRGEFRAIVKINI